MLSFVLLIIGFIILIKGADLLVDGASSFAKKIGISSLVVGLTVVSFGTSAPELIVNLVASFQGANDLALANILGSNIANILLILGVAAIISPPLLGHGTVWKEIPFSLLAAIVLAIVANDAYFRGMKNGLDRADGLILLLFFVIFLYYVYSISKTLGEDKSDTIKMFTKTASVIMVITGSVGLALGGKMVVDSAVQMGKILGFSESLVGLTIVALGTSLPELATSVVAAKKRQSSIVVGNIIGSNIFNIFWILGLSSFISPIYFSGAANFDIFTVVFVTLTLFFFMFIGKKHVLDRFSASILISFYFFYIAFIFVRG